MNFKPEFRNRAKPSSMPCPNCRRLISIKSKECAYCGYRIPRFTANFPFLGDLIRGDIKFTNNIILACFILYAVAILLDIPGAFSNQGSGLNILNLLSPSNTSLYKLDMGGLYPWLTGRWWLLLTATYLHAGILHILFNMLWLRQIGPLVEELYGSSRFIILYTLAGIGGSILSTVAGTPLFVGASGAIFGLFGALIFYGFHRGGTFGQAIFRQTLVWAGIGFIMGFALKGVDNWGHLGGFLCGLALSFLLSYQEKGKQALWHHILATVVTVLIGICFILMFIMFFKS